MPKRWNVSGHDLVVDWDTPGVIHHGEFVENDDVDLLPPLGGDWSDDPKDAERSAVAGASVLSDEEKAAYAAPEKRKSKGADPAPVVPAPESPVDAPQEG